jgi:RNA polymerase sigma-70 factor (ECF subfamily)
VPDPTAVLADDEALVAAIRAGDTAAFGRWLAGSEPRLRDSLRSFAARIDVEAVLQEALLRVWQVAPRFVPDGQPEALLRLAVRIARNLAVDTLRRSRLEPFEADALERLAISADLAPPAPDRWSDPMLRRAIEECRRRLPDKPARALQARIESGGAEPDERLAQGLRMRRNTFVQNVVRARRFLADCLRRRGIDLAAELS